MLQGTAVYDWPARRDRADSRAHDAAAHACHAFAAIGQGDDVPESGYEEHPPAGDVLGDEYNGLIWIGVELS